MARWNFKNPVTFDVNCDVCGSNRQITCDLDDVESWKNGTSIKDCLNYLHSDQIELLISGTCSDCFNQKEAKYYNE